MTPEARYQFIREQSNVFTNKNMLRHHLIIHLKEAASEQREQDAKIAEMMGATEVAFAIRAAREAS